MRWVWDRQKNEHNLARHGLVLEAGELVLDGDRYAMSRPNPFARGKCWQTIGSAAGVVVLSVVHTDPKASGTLGHIISVRKATANERKIYESGAF